MRSFKYVRPTDLDKTLELLGHHGADASVLSGGTDLLVGLRKGKLTADVVVDVKGVNELCSGIQESSQGLVIGANTVMSDAVEDPRIRQDYPALVEAAVTVGSIQIRNRATFSGNICNASPAADTVLPLLMYAAEVEVAGPEGTRRVALDDFIIGPGRTALGRGEVVVAIHLPAPAGPRGTAFARMTRRRGVDLATVNLCASVDSHGQTTFTLGAVGPRPLLVSDASRRLAAEDLGDEEQQELLAVVLDDATPISDVRGSADYRTAMLAVLARRSLRTAKQRLRAGGAA